MASTGLSSLQQDIVLHPLKFVELFFNEYFSIPRPSFNGDWEIPALFSKHINNVWEKIPSLNTFEFLEQVPSGTLVRYRGMIQDMFDPEYYLGLYESSNLITGEKRKLCGKYRDTIEVINDEIEIDPKASSSIPLERLPLLLIPIPGETFWSRKQFENRNYFSLFPSDSQQRTKRRLPSLEEDNSNNLNKDRNAISSEVRYDSKKHRTKLSLSSDSIENRMDPTIFSVKTLNECRTPCCLVKVYDDLTENHFKLNEIIEFVGIVFVDTPPESLSINTNEDPLSLDLPTETFSDIVLPRLHCLCYRKLDHFLLVASSIPKLYREIGTINPKELALWVRKDLIAYLSCALGNDDLVAEYLLLNLLCRVFKRHHTFAVGKLSINIVSFPEREDFRSTLQSVLSSLVAKLVFFPLTLNNLNQVQLVPKKNYETNRLSTGLLQLCEGTHLVLDETQLTAGSLDGTGTKNLQYLNETLLWQHVQYDFLYNQIEFPVDIPTLILSSGKSLLGCDCRIPLLNRNNPFIPSQMTNEDFLDRCRFYIAFIRSFDFELSEELTKIVQEDFVRIRKQNASVTQEDFHLWLTLARLISLSFGENSLTQERWEYVTSLEKARTARLQSNEKGNNHY